MAKGSPLMGTQSGKRGEAVLYRTDGRQVERAWVSTPRNPRTPQQIYQRMFMATMGKAMQGMKKIVDHSFEAVSPGSHSLRYFMKRNIAQIRNAAYYNYSEQVWRVKEWSFITPRWDYMTWNPYLMSEGSLPAITRLQPFALSGVPLGGALENTDVSRRCMPLFINDTDVSLIGNSIYELIHNYLHALSCKVGDYMTAVFVSANAGDIAQGAGVIYPCRFHYVRFVVGLIENEGEQYLAVFPSNVDGQSHQWNTDSVLDYRACALPWEYNGHTFPYLDMFSMTSSQDGFSTLGGGRDFQFDMPLQRKDEILSYCWIHSRPQGKRFLVSTQRMLLADTSGDVYESNLSTQDAYDEWVNIRKKVGDNTTVLNGGNE